ncbi:hypothetical protein [Micromonospora sp. NPDC005324]|uniref:hypothetical protein n=1 Tax=Micromonospora sp. NPDC005324 TaxID=3157033 RepID=UPI00339EE4CD
MPAYRLRTLAAAALVPLLAVVAGCSTGAAPAAEAAGQPRSGGTLTWAVETEPITLNPHQYAQAKARLLVWTPSSRCSPTTSRASLCPGWRQAGRSPRTG